MVNKDLWFSMALFLFGAVMFQQSLAMPTFVHLGAHLLTSPGLTPGILGLVICVLAAVMFFRSANALGWSLSLAFRSGAETGEAAGNRRLLLALALTIGFAAGLVGWLPFSIAVVIFVFLFTLTFEWPFAQSVAEKRKLVLISSVLAVAVGLIVPFIFAEVFLVRLP